MIDLKKIMIVNGFVGPRMPRIQYSNYKNLLKQAEINANKVSSVKNYFIPTSNRIANFYGANTDLLATCQSSEYVDRIYQMMNKKGYGLPKRAIFMEEAIPSYSGILAITQLREMAFNPRSIDRFAPRSVFHEYGHLLHPLIQKHSSLFGRIVSLKDKLFPICNKNEIEILKSDYQRAYKEGLFQDDSWKYLLKDKLFCFGNVNNKDLRFFRKKNIIAEKHAEYPLTDRYEFVADVFSLKVQGFKFSPEIEAKYLKFGGPKVEEVFSKEELAELSKFRKQIRKKSLSDYGLTCIYG